MCSSDLTPAGGSILPGDNNGDGAFNIADGIDLLNKLYLNSHLANTCDGEVNEGGNLMLHDWNGDSTLNISDCVSVFHSLFAKGARSHTLGDACTLIVGCPEACAVSKP